jgi:dihydropteroate synthase
MRYKTSLLPVRHCLQSKGKLLDLAQPLIMGILNATPDSFYTGGQDSSATGLLVQAAQMIRDGAAILDVGGASTRPGAPALSAAEEMERVLPVISAISREFPEIWISVDTYQASVAAAAIAAGAHIVNDISAGKLDPQMLATVAALKVPYIAMHMQGNPQTMQQNPVYTDVTMEVCDYLASVCMQCQEAGITDIILDPGFGFGKTISHNYELLSGMQLLRSLQRPLLAGISRKSMIYRPLGTSAAEALNGTTALHMVCLQQGASILRVHDVREAAEAIKLFQLLS